MDEREAFLTDRLKQMGFVNTQPGYYEGKGVYEGEIAILDPPYTEILIYRDATEEELAADPDNPLIQTGQEYYQNY